MNMNESRNTESDNNTKDDAERKSISLSQAILAPLDAIFKAQLHGARSFLNMLLQLGYHPPSDNEDSGNEKTASDKNGQKKKKGKTPYMFEFTTEKGTGDSTQQYSVKMPAIALVPVQPIAISRAEYELELTVHQIKKHRQTQKTSEVNKDDKHVRPWFLVEEPISIRGFLAAPRGEQVKDKKDGSSESSRAESTIKVKVTVEKAPMPSGLNKLLTSLTEMGTAEEVQKKDENI